MLFLFVLQFHDIIKIIKKDYKKARERYLSFSKEGKERKQQYICKRQKNLAKDEKQKLVEYRKKITE